MDKKMSRTERSRTQELTLALGFGIAWLVSLSAPQSGAQAKFSGFPPYLAKDFDYATFTRFEAAAPPKDLIYQSNGHMALQEKGFAGQTVIIPVSGDPVPTNSSDRLLGAEIDAPVFTDASGKTYRFTDSASERHLAYYADRTVYRAAFDGGVRVSVTVYPVYGKPASVLTIDIEKASGPIRVHLATRGKGFALLPSEDARVLEYGSPRWSYRLYVGSRPQAHFDQGELEWELATGGTASVLLALGEDRKKASAVLEELASSSDLLSQATHQSWNDYLASVPLVAPAEPIHFTIGTSGRQETIAPEELVRSELWFWRGVLTTTCQALYLPACPLTIADWNVFLGMWGNDGIAESLALAATGRKDLARGAILNWFRYSVNAAGDGTAAWTIFPSGKNTFAAEGPERQTQSVPVQGSLVGQYVRLTGDKTILDERPGGASGNRTLWEALVAYQENLPKVRDSNHDHLIDWLHTYETGWDDKNSPFVDLKGVPTSAMNEQVFNLWSLSEMVYLSASRGQDATPWQKEFAAANEAVRRKLWDERTGRYWDLDLSSGKLWTAGENLDAYYFLYYETDPMRVASMMKRLKDPEKFDGVLLPTMAFDTPHWGGYWRGPAWPRVFSYVALALDRAGERREAFEWLARAIQSNLGPLLPENVDPKAYPPGEHAIGSVRIMGYNALDTLVFPDVAGLRVWAGEDLTIVPNPRVGKLFVKNQKWMGDSYDALFEPGKATRIWREGREFEPLEANRIWRARKKGSDVSFEPIGTASGRKSEN
jgi:hypothetical protein